MKHLSIVLLYLLCVDFTYSQTLYPFSNTTASNHDSWNTGNSWATALVKNITVSGVPTSGMVLRQINLNLGSASGSNITSLQARLVSAGGQTVTLFSSGYFYDTDFSRFVTIKLRDHAKLKALNEYTNSYLGMPYSYGYYRVATAGSFANFNTTTNVNGTWALQIIENTGVEIQFNSVELIFGPPFNITDISSTSLNNKCSSARCVQTNEIIIGTNNSYPQNQAVYPPLNVSGCNWNAEKNNTAWFFFTPTSTNVNLSVSGFTNNVQQTVVFKIAGSCSSPTYSLIACPTSMFVGSCNSTTGHATQYHRVCYDGGTKFNHGYSLSGLTVGDNYLFIIDGLSGANSDFYVELLSGADNGCNYVLPVELVSFEASQNLYNNILSWQTASEVNNSHFEIEKSKDAISFEKIGTVKSKYTNGNSSRNTSYYFNDLLSSAYYRLKQVDNDGSFSYSKTVFVETTKTPSRLKIYPNPSEGLFNIENIFEENEIINIQVYDVFGKLISKETTLNNQSTLELNLADLEAGWYFISIEQAGKRFQEKVLITK